MPTSIPESINDKQRDGPATVAELHGLYIEDLAPGMTAVHAKTVTEADVTLFAGISGDDNPLHMNEDFAAAARFGRRIVHGMLSAGFISAAIATRLPGPGAIYLSQSLRFTAPVSIGDTVSARVTVTEVNRDKKRVKLATVCWVGETVVIDGEAEVWVPARG